MLRPEPVAPALLAPLHRSPADLQSQGIEKRLDLQIRILQKTIKELNEKLQISDANAKLQGSVSPLTSIPTDYSPSSRYPSSPSLERRQRAPSGDNDGGILFGSAPTMGFVESVQGYMDDFGYDTSLLDARAPGEETLHSSRTSSDAEALQIRNLQALLPTKTNGEKLLHIFQRHLRMYIPIMCWSIVRNKFERAYGTPIFAEDRLSVTGIFCVLMTINAYASVCSDDSDVFEVPNYSSRRGWYFLEFAKNFHDLHRSSHSFALCDVEVLLTMAMYLERTALSYPLRLTVEYLATVCKDIGLHRKDSRDNLKLSSVELEHQSRIFWCAFLLDQKIALQFGVKPILNGEEVDVDEPGSNDLSDLADSTPHLSKPETPMSIMLMRSLVAISQFIGPILRLDPKSLDTEHQMNQIEQQLDYLEGNFPGNLLKWESFAPLDPALLDAAILAMAIRLSLFRFFTDATLKPDFRARCLLRCLEVAKGTVYLLRRTMKFPDWEHNFRQRQCGLTYQHIFKVSTIFLLAAAIFPKPVEIESELCTCVGVLQIAASTRPSVVQNLHTLDKLSEILKQKPATGWGGSYNSPRTTMPPQIGDNIAGCLSSMPPPPPPFFFFF
ncbi:hypothetical protein TWF481_000531 [Arthrobotrys musiformis]|uniref:Xylanolytic transcriptional activator regulatory domain-containing protein n=1 Tax=Arthrobotrys musiformis TaxID=47236 RepID=A0AAV9WMW0_9PEZI